MGDVKDSMAVDSGGKWALALLVVYCLAEAAYNLALMGLLSTSGIDISAFESLEKVGKALGSFGLALFISKLFKSPRASLAVCLLGTPLFYVGLDRGIDAWLEGLSSEEKASSYYVSGYRLLNVQKDIADPALEGLSDSARQVAIVNIPLVLKDKSAAARATVEWTLEPLKDAAKSPAVAELCSSYKSALEPLSSLWPLYAIESRKWQNLPSGSKINDIVRARYAQAFEKKAGVPPGLDKQGFLKAIAASHPGADKVMSAEIIPSKPEWGIEAVRVSDIPSGLDEAGCRAFFGDKGRDSLTKARSAAAEVSNKDDWKRLVSGALVPPVSMTLSLFSLTLNGAAALALALGMALRKGRSFERVGAALGVVACAGLWFSAPETFNPRIEQSGVVAQVVTRAMNAETVFLDGAGKGGQGVARSIVALVPAGSASVGKMELKRGDMAQFDVSELTARFADLKNISAGSDGGVVADEAQIEKSGYYGEAKTGGNPYAK